MADRSQTQGAVLGIVAGVVLLVAGHIWRRTLQWPQWLFICLVPLAFIAILLAGAGRGQRGQTILWIVGVAFAALMIRWAQG